MGVQELVLTVSGQVATVNYTYQAPIISTMLPNNGMVDPACPLMLPSPTCNSYVCTHCVGPTTGEPTLVVLTGFNFGVSGQGFVLIGDRQCDITLHTHTEIRCTPPHGVGSVEVFINAGGQIGQASQNFTYDSPVVSSVNPIISFTNGTENITLFGENFGIVGDISVGGR